MRPSRHLPSKCWLHVAIAAFAWTFVPMALEAQEGGAPRISGTRVEAHGVLGWGLGAGLRLEVPIVPNGFLRGSGSVRDEFALGFGGEALVLFLRDGHADLGLALAPVGVFVWNVYLNRRWSIFPELGATIVFGGPGIGRFAHRDDHGSHYHIDVDGVIGFGLRYHSGRRSAFVVRFNYPFGLHLGVTF